jgi:hypothetical protein
VKPDKSDAYRTATLIIVTNLAFLLLLYLVPYIAKLNVPFSHQTLSAIKISGIMSLLSGLGLLFWLLTFKRKFQSAWTSILLYSFSLLLIEYWYFGMRLLSLITK